MEDKLKEYKLNVKVGDEVEVGRFRNVIAKVKAIEIDENGSWQPLDLNKMYGMVSNNFIRGGGDGYKVFRSASEIYDFGPDLADVVANYINANPGYSGYTDNRITQE